MSTQFNDNTVYLPPSYYSPDTGTTELGLLALRPPVPPKPQPPKRNAGFAWGFGSAAALVGVFHFAQFLTAVGVLHRAVAWFAQHGISVERVLSDNGACYRSHAWRNICLSLGITHKRTRPYRPQTNGKLERFHRTLADGWAYTRRYHSETERRAALPGWLHFYNHHRPHSAIAGQPPITRLTNVPGHHI